MPTDLLPPNATPLERGVSLAVARAGAVAVPIEPLWDAETCPEAVLPWLAWALSVDRWVPEWPAATKRAAIAASIGLHRRKGTRDSVESVIRGFDQVMQLVEWFEATPPRPPYTFDIVMPIDAYPGAVPGAAIVETIVREVVKVKPVRAHFAVAQTMTGGRTVHVVAGAKPAGLVRLAMTAALGAAVVSGAITTEGGLPLTTEAGASFQVEQA